MVADSGTSRLLEGRQVTSSLEQVFCAVDGHGHDSTAGPMLHVEGIAQLC